MDIRASPEQLIRKNNVINCHPPKNANPTTNQIECCRPRVERDIELSKPVLILCVGSIPARWLVPDDKGISAWRGRMVPVKVRSHSCWAMLTFHPSYLLRGKLETDDFVFWKRDLETVLRFVFTEPTPPRVDCHSPTAHVQKLLTYADIYDTLRDLLEKPPKYMAVDIETTGLRPTKKGSKILSFALSYEMKKTIAFPWKHPKFQISNRQMQELRSMLNELFTNEEIEFIAHNAAFEQEWIFFFIGKRKKPWRDTMLREYCLNTQGHILSLDALIKSTFGFGLKALSPVDVKNLAKYPIQDVLEYNGLDAKWTYRLFMRQVQSLKKDRETALPTSRWLEASVRVLVLCQLKGLRVDWDRHKELMEEFQAHSAKTILKISKRSEVEEYAQRYGSAFNIQSNPDQVRMFRDMLQRSEGFKDDESDKYSVDKTALEKMVKEVPLAKLILSYREYEKMASTFLRPLPRIVHQDGRIHTSYSTINTVTGRTASSGPNVQQFPNHTHREIREIIIPPPGYVVAPFDYASIQARLIAMASRDPTFCNMVWDNYDVHMDWAKRIAKATKDDGWMKDIEDPAELKLKRQLVKNKWVFPLFFGSTFKATSRDLHIDIGKAKKLNGLFWEMFAGVKQWQDRLVSGYEKYGYVESLSGQRRYGPIPYTKIINTTIQADECYVVLDAGNRVEAAVGMVYDIEVHDDLTYMLPENKIKSIAKKIAIEMTRPVKDWMCVPLEVELKVGPNWGQQKEIAVYTSKELHGHTQPSSY